MKQGDRIKLKADFLGSEGQGVGKADGVLVYAKNLLAGETAEARVSYVKRGAAYAEVKKIFNESKDRATPQCQKFLKCGGCQLQHLKYDAQLEFKRNLVKQNLSKIGKIDFDVLPVEPSLKQWGYRNKVQFPVGTADGRPILGLFKDRTHKLVEIKNCPLQKSWAKKLADAFLAYATKLKLSVYDETTRKGLLRHLIGRYVCGQLLVTVVVNGDDLPFFSEFAALLKRDFDDFGLFVNVNKQNTNVILGDKTKHLCGLKYISGETMGIDFVLRPDSFFQVNFDVMRAIYSDVKRLLSEYGTEVLVDCFSGAGLLSACLYTQGVKEYCIEIVPSATADAENMKKLNNLTDMTNICGDVATELPKVLAENVGKRTAVVLDPPRKGIAASTAKLLTEVKPDVIVYVSCDSATLSRDLQLLTQDGVYKVEYVKPYDMFPQTKHVETLCALSRQV